LLGCGDVDNGRCVGLADGDEAAKVTDDATARTCDVALMMLSAGCWSSTALTTAAGLTVVSFAPDNTPQLA